MNPCEETLEHLRNKMVKEQLSGRDIREARLLDVFRKVPRHRFIDPLNQENAYGDFPLEIGSGQTISQPYIVALMVQFINVNSGDRVLEIGTGSGYETAILGELSKEVFSVERIRSLAEKAEKILSQLGYINIKINVGDGTLGWQDFAPFDKIIVAASSPDVPRPLIDQLAPGGSMVIPIGPRLSQRLVIIEKSTQGHIIKKEGSSCIFVPLIGEHAWKTP